MTRQDASQIRTEIKQSVPFSSLEQEVVVALIRTTDVVRRQVAAIIEPSGITIQQYNVLRILRGAGENGLPTLEIAERMIERTPGITRLIDRLVTKGLVLRERSESDRRQVICWVTEGGLELLARLDSPVANADLEPLTTIPRKDLHTLLAILDDIRKAER